MKITTTTTCDLSQEEIDLFMTAMTRARGISTWGRRTQERIAGIGKAPVRKCR